MFFKKKKEEPDAYQNADLNCPRCNVVMKKLEHPSKATLDVCPKCGGMWLDRDEVQLLYKAEQKEHKPKKEKVNKPKRKK